MLWPQITGLSLILFGGCKYLEWKRTL